MEQKQNMGALFDSRDNIHKQGSININGKQHKIIVKKYQNAEGKDKYALYLQLGFMDINTNKADNPKRPDWLGNLTYNTFKHNISGWNNISKNNNEYVSLNIKMANGDEKKI